MSPLPFTQFSNIIYHAFKRLCMCITIMLVYEINTLESAEIAEALLHIKTDFFAKLVNEYHCPFKLLVVAVLHSSFYLDDSKKRSSLNHHKF